MEFYKFILYPFAFILLSGPRSRHFPHHVFILYPFTLILLTVEEVGFFKVTFCDLKDRLRSALRRGNRRNFHFFRTA